MKATKLAHFFGLMSRLEIRFDVDHLDGFSFKVFFGVEGTFLSVYVTDNSLAQDYFIDAAKEDLNYPAIYKYPSPYTEDDNELMYIIRITNEEDEW